jgi:hypothetical protein
MTSPGRRMTETTRSRSPKWKVWEMQQHSNQGLWHAGGDVRCKPRHLRHLSGQCKHDKRRAARKVRERKHATGIECETATLVPRRARTSLYTIGRMGAGVVVLMKGKRKRSAVRSPMQTLRPVPVGIFVSHRNTYTKEGRTAERIAAMTPPLIEL